ncbi:MAG: YidC/Oxa1 family membrane protein insertase [Patescibacteria group bacterium]
MIYLFNEILYKPLFSVLFFLSNNLGDAGLAIIFLTIFVRLVLFPIFYKGAKDQAIMQLLSPKIKEIQNKHKDNKGEQGKALMDLYREHKVNPLSGFLLILIQLPILIALYKIFSALPGSLNTNFLGIIDLNKENLIIIGLAAIAQYFQGKLSIVKNEKSLKDLTAVERMGRQMVYFGPILTIIFLYTLPAAVGLYWLTTSVFSVIQQIVINKRLQVSDEKLIEIDKELHHKN